MHTGRFIKVTAAFLTAALLFTGCSDSPASPDAPSAPSGSGSSNGSENSSGNGSTNDGGSSDNGDSSGSEKTAKSVTEIYGEIEQAVSLKSPQLMDEDFILNYYDIDTTALEEYVFSMSEDAAQAETVILMKVKNPDDVETFADCLQTIVEDKKGEMEDYIPEQFAIVEKSRVQTRDTYVWLVISDNADAIIDIIESGLF